MEQVAIITFFILSFVNGYFIGKWNAEFKNERAEEVPSRIKSFVNEVLDRDHDDSYVGAVHRPSADRLDRMRHPEKYEGEEEMKKELGKIPELQQ